MDKLLWKTINKCEFNKEDDFLETILTQAGIEDIHEFLNVGKRHTHDPFLFRNMNEGVELLHSKLGGTVFIKRDTDVDGLTSSCYAKGFIEKISPETTVICNTMYQKEHGIFISDIEEYVDVINLIIVPDAGSTSVKECKEIKEKYNIPILILDHHEIDDDILNYATVINCTDGVYPNPTLSGVGVVHKFALAYSMKYEINEDICNYYLDLVALGIRNCANISFPII